MATTTFDFDAKTEKVIKQLKKRYGATSKAEILRKALALLSTISDAEEKGAEVILREDNKEKQVIVR